MKLFKKIPGLGSNKHDVKIAQLELEKAKIEKAALEERNFIEKEKIKNQEKSNIIDGYLEYSKNNFDNIIYVITTLKNDIQISVSKIQNAEYNNLTTKEKSQIKKEKSSCQEKLKYLYLSKDFLVYLTKYASGIVLSEEQTSLVSKFARYFDGVQVIEIEEYGDENDRNDDYDDSLVGGFKEIAKEFGSMFYKPKSSSKTSKPIRATKFYFYDYLEKYHEEKISQLKIPEMASVIETFKKVVISINDTSNKLGEQKIDTSQNNNECPICNSKVSNNTKFCSQCGSKIEITRPMICEECDFTLAAGAKFCPNCGHKVH